MTGTRKATTEDITLIQQLAEAIWPEAYENIISPGQIRYMLDLIYSPNALADQFQKGHRFIIAYHESIPIGFASFSKKSLEEPNIFRLHKLYVLPRQQGQGVGSSLLDMVITESRLVGGTHLELNVNKHNPAKNFYSKKGFTILRDEVLDIGNGFVMDDYVMQLKI